MIKLILAMAVVASNRESQSNLDPAKIRVESIDIRMRQLATDLGYEPARRPEPRTTPRDGPRQPGAVHRHVRTRNKSVESNDPNPTSRHKRPAASGDDHHVALREGPLMPQDASGGRLARHH
jgi:hypothetical protein